MISDHKHDKYTQTRGVYQKCFDKSINPDVVSHNLLHQRGGRQSVSFNSYAFML
ncbi:hypothetical protein SAMN06265379_101116 [Saccharicrinis carchari]|uniref:Uncharacterized protein n=1 Tax=Saccharicrinis carchari TaxID=1168039 RepID=A0A521AFU2_SACCC|nr:hypothetical protein SAMN06265379_101116 [Saccharicrinis carchari]